MLRSAYPPGGDPLDFPDTPLALKRLPRGRPTKSVIHAALGLPPGGDPLDFLIPPPRAHNDEPAARFLLQEFSPRLFLQLVALCIFLTPPEECDGRHKIALFFTSYGRSIRLLGSISKVLVSSRRARAGSRGVRGVIVAPSLTGGATRRFVLPNRPARARASPLRCPIARLPFITWASLRLGAGQLRFAHGRPGRLQDG